MNNLFKMLYKKLRQLFGFIGRIMDCIMPFFIIFFIIKKGDVLRTAIISSWNKSEFTIKGDATLFLLLLFGVFSVIEFLVNQFLKAIRVSTIYTHGLTALIGVATLLAIFL